jgi:hypothetical protein
MISPEMEYAYILVIIIEQRRDPPEEGFEQTDNALSRCAAERKSPGGDYAYWTAASQTIPKCPVEAPTFTTKFPVEASLHSSKK